jgi:hypothetical protein
MADDMELMQRAGFLVRNARRLGLHNIEVTNILSPNNCGVAAKPCGCSAISTCKIKPESQGRRQCCSLSCWT